MTTTAYDVSAFLMTSDSRWSITIGGTKIAYVDDTGFDKIELACGHAFLFAGDSGVIDAWKRYVRSGNGGAIPGLQGIALLAVNAATKATVVCHGQDIALPDPVSMTASFAGSGARHAALCWMANKCGKKAIDTAKGLDVYTGGDTKFANLESSAHNLRNDVGVDDLGKQFLAKGVIMYVNGQTQPIAEAAANDAEVRQVCEKIAQGSITLSAPCDAMLMKPSDDDIARVQTAMDTIFKK